MSADIGWGHRRRFAAVLLPLVMCSLIAGEAWGADDCGLYVHSDKPWTIRWTDSEHFVWSLGETDLEKCAVSGPMTLDGQVGLTCQGTDDGPRASESWYKAFSGADGTESSTMLWGNEVYYYRNC